MKYLYGIELQKQILKYLIIAKRKDIFDFINDSFFDDYEAKLIIRFIIDNLKSGDFPCLDTIRVGCGGTFISDDEMSDEKKKIINYLDIIAKLDINQDAISGILTEFVKTQKFRKIRLTIETDFAQGKMNVDEYIKDLRSISNVTLDKDVGIVYSEQKEIIIIQNEKVPTHLHTLNKWLKGGLMKGELGFIMGGTGVGKSWFLVNIGAAIYEIGKNVFYYTFELSAPNVKLRFDSRFSGFNDEEIMKKQEKFKRRVEKVNKGGELIIVGYPSGRISVYGLEAHMDKIKDVYGIEPDVVLVDYLDLVKPASRTGNDWLDIGSICSDLRAIAQERNFAVWTVSQIKPEFYGKEFDLNAVRRSAEKVHDADIVLGVFLDTVDPSKMYVKGLKFRRTKSYKETISVQLDLEHGIMREIKGEKEFID